VEYKLFNWERLVILFLIGELDGKLLNLMMLSTTRKDLIYQMHGHHLLLLLGLVTHHGNYGKKLNLTCGHISNLIW